MPTYAIDLGDGDQVIADVTPESMALVRRVDAAMRAGDQPAPEDLALLLEWLDEQERRYPSR